VAQQRSKRRSRKRRKPASGGAGAPPRAVPAPRRELRAERQAAAERVERRARSSLGTYGERPPGPFGGLPISEIAIFAGGVGVIVGLIQGGGAALIVGIVVCALGVIEVTAREHFSGYRSHAMLLAAIPAVALDVLLVVLVGTPGRRSDRALLLLAVVPVFGALFWLLRKRFQVARQGRVVRPPGA
jgi:hypothetical protein